MMSSDWPTPRVESENAAGSQIPETDDAVGIEGDNGVACGLEDSIRNAQIRIVEQVHLDLRNYFSVISVTRRAPQVRSVSLTCWNKPTPSTAYTHIFLFVLLLMKKLPGFASIN
jgi:hypothetical protein